MYTRLYEPTVASHYYLAMAQIEGRMGQHEADSTPDPRLMLALVDSLHAGTLNEAQWETMLPQVTALRRLWGKRRSPLSTVPASASSSPDARPR